MRFTNMTGRGLYFTCCRREVEPGGSFEAPWKSCEHDRAVRNAMADGSLGWESGAGEPHVPGSVHVPTAEERAAAAAKEKAERDAMEAEDERKTLERMERDDAGVRANMALMGRFDLPMRIHRRTPERAGVGERPVTSADIISDGRPGSVEEAERHNKAVKAMRVMRDIERRRVVFNPKAGDAGDAGDSKAVVIVKERKNGQ